MPQFFGELENRYGNDLYFVNLVAGRTYYFEMEGAATGQGTLADPDLHLYRNADLVAFGGDAGVGLNSRIVFTATHTGAYMLEAQTAGNSGGTYRLNAFEDDFRSTVEGAGPYGSAPTGQTVSGRLNYVGDRDLFGSVLVAGLQYTIEMHGSSSLSGTLSDPHLRLLDRSDNVIASVDDYDGRLDPDLFYHASASGVHFIQAAAHDDDGSGTFRLSVSAGLASAGADHVVATGSPDAIHGLHGNDTILGGNGNDWLSGDSGADTLRGQTGNDLLRGGFQADRLIGGTGGDTFIFVTDNLSDPARDRIAAGDNATAFQGAGNPGGDRIDLRGMDADLTDGGDQAFVFGGVGKGHLSLINRGTTTIVRGNVDNDAAFEFEIAIEDAGVRAAAYAAVDFML